MNETENRYLFHIEWHSLFRDLVRNAWVILLSAMIGFMSVSMAAGVFYTPTYTSTATLLIYTKSASYQMYSNLSASMEMAEVFTRILQQSAVEVKAAEYLSAERFSGDVRAVVLSGTNIVSVSVTDTDPDRAYRQLCAVLAVHPEITGAVFTDAVVEIMQAPNAPQSPSNAPLNVSRGFAAIVGGGVAAAAIVCFSVLRDTVRDEDEFTQKIGGALFGTIAHVPDRRTLADRIRRRKHALLVHDPYASFRFAENYRKLAYRLSYLNRRDGAQVFLFTSVAENEGKSSVSVNTALSLAAAGHRVVLLDMDFLKPVIHKILDMPTEEYDFGSMLSAMAANKPSEKFRFLRYKNTSLHVALNRRSHTEYEEWVRSGAVERLLNLLRTKYTHIIIDTPPISASADVVHLSGNADAAFLVVRTDVVAAPYINDAVYTLSENGGSFAGCVLNDVYPEFTLFGQTGADESGYYGRYGYNSYGGYHSYRRPTDMDAAANTEEGGTT